MCLLVYFAPVLHLLSFLAKFSWLPVWQVAILAANMLQTVDGDDMGGFDA